MTSDPTIAVEALDATARALQRVAVGPGRIESTLQHLADRWGVSAEFLALPGAVWASYGGSGEAGLRLLQAPGVDEDLGQLEQVLALCEAAIQGRIGPEAVVARLARLRATPPPARWRVLGSFGLLSATAALLFGGGLPEALAGAGAGLAVGAVVSSRLQALVEAAAAVAAAFVGAGLAGLLGATADRVVLAGLIVLVPGYTMHRGLEDLSTGHLISGSARMAQAATTLLMMAFGVALGGAAAEQAFGAVPATTPTPGLPAWARPGLLLAMVPGLLVLFRAPRGLAPAVGAALLAAWSASGLGEAALGSGLGPLAGALALGLGAEAWSRWTHRPAALLITPALMVLVSGALGFRGVDALLRGLPDAAVQTGFEALLATASLVAGLLVAGAIADGPKRTGPAAARGAPAPPSSATAGGEAAPAPIGVGFSAASPLDPGEAAPQRGRLARRLQRGRARRFRWPAS